MTRGKRPPRRSFFGLDRPWFEDSPFDQLVMAFCLLAMAGTILWFVVYGIIKIVEAVG